jgi:hypothetical protein
MDDQESDGDGSGGENRDDENGNEEKGKKRKGERDEVGDFSSHINPNYSHDLDTSPSFSIIITFV